MKTLKKLTLVAVFAFTNLVGFSNGNSNTNASTNGPSSERDNLAVANELTFEYGCPYNIGYHYNYQGNSSIETRFQYEYSSYYGCNVQVFYQRQLNWFEYSQTVYGPNGPYTSYYWTCTWSAWFRT